MKSTLLFILLSLSASSLAHSDATSHDSKRMALKLRDRHVVQQRDGGLLGGLLGGNGDSGSGTSIPNANGDVTPAAGNTPAGQTPPADSAASGATGAASAPSSPAASAPSSPASASDSGGLLGGLSNALGSAGASTQSSTTLSSSSAPSTTQSSAAPSSPPPAVTSTSFASALTPTATSNADTSSNKSSGMGKKTIIAVAIVGGVIGGFALLWTIIRKTRFSPSKRFEDKLNPIEFGDEPFGARVAAAGGPGNPHNDGAGYADEKVGAGSEWAYGHSRNNSGGTDYSRGGRGMPPPPAHLNLNYAPSLSRSDSGNGSQMGRSLVGRDGIPRSTTPQIPGGGYPYPHQQPQMPYGGMAPSGPGGNLPYPGDMGGPYGGMQQQGLGPQQSMRRPASPGAGYDPYYRGGY